MIVQFEEGAVLAEQILLGTASPQHLVLHLLGAVHTMAHTDTQLGLSPLELVVGGYAPVDLTAAASQWTITPNADGASALYAVVNWNLTGAATIFGYWVEWVGTHKAWFGETFPVPFAYTSAGGPFQLQPSLYLVSQPFQLGPCQ